MASLQLILIRGLPGSGKTHKAGELRDRIGPRSSIMSADDFFYDGDGVYRYDPRLIAQAHADCQVRTMCMLAKGVTSIVHNNFVQQWEMEPYKAMALLAKAELVVIDLFDAGLSDEQLAARNVHGVPAETIRQMRANYQR